MKGTDGYLYRETISELHLRLCPSFSDLTKSTDTGQGEGHKALCYEKNLSLGS